jgi:hypothetical protein
MPSVGSILRELHIPWPAANEGSLRAAAAAWHSLAETIRDNYGQANSNAASLTSNNAGAAIDAFENYWQKFGGQKGALPLGARACDAMASACSQYADAVASTKNRIEEAGAEVAATLVIGTIGAFFTFGATEGIADSVAAGLAATVAGYIDDLTGIVGGIVAAAGDVVADALESDLAASIGSSVLSGAATGIGGTITGDTAQNAVRQLFRDQPLSSADVRQDLIVAGLAGGATGGLLGKLGDLTAGQLSRVLTNTASSVADTDPQLFVDMMTLAKTLEGTTGKVSSGVLASVASQLITTQQISAEGIASDQLEELLERVADG